MQGGPPSNRRPLFFSKFVATDRGFHGFFGLKAAPRPPHRMARMDHAHNAPRRWPAIVSVAVLIATCLAAGASAQLDVGDTADTFVTPDAKTTDAWVRYAGAEY